MMLVTGANGAVGGYVRREFAGDSVHWTDIQEMDITDFRAVQKVFESVKPETVLHLGALTDVDYCEQHPDHAYKVNTLGTQNLALLCQKMDALMVYVSTGGVFGGEKPEPYTEFDAPNPANVYARSKWEGEKVIQSFLRRYFIVRAGWMMGGGRKDKKFVAKILDLCETRKEIMAVSDKFGTPTYALHFVQGIKKLMATGFYGLYHMGNEGMCSRYDIAREIVRLVNRPVIVKPVPSSYFPLPAPRAQSEALDNYKLKLMGLNSMPTWKSALSDYISELHSPVTQPAEAHSRH